MIHPRTIIHQDLWLGKLVPSPHKKVNLVTESTAHSEAEIRESVKRSNSLGEETGLVYISPSHWDLECQGVMIPGTPDVETRSFAGLLAAPFRPL